MSLPMSNAEPSQTSPAAFASAAILPPCHCTSTGAIVGITLAAASTASVFTMLFLLCLLRRSGRSTSTKLAPPTMDPIPISKYPNPSPSSIRDTVILISPDREAPLLSIGAELRRSSESHYSQDSRHNRDVGPKSGFRISVPQLPTIHLSPSLLALSTYMLESKSKSKYSASNLSSPPPPPPSLSFIYDDAGDVLSSGRMPSVIDSFVGSDGRGLPSMIEGDGSSGVGAGVDPKMKVMQRSLEVNSVAPPKTSPVNAARATILLPLYGRSR